MEIIMHRFILPVFVCHFFLIGHLLPAENEQVSYPAELLSRYIRHASVTGNERIAGLFLSTVARQKGLHVEILTDEPASFNFTASLYPLELGKPNIIFLNHIDVVPPGPVDEYTHPPFSGAIDNGMVWGRGALDMKGMAIMQLLALVHYRELAHDTDLPFNVTMLAVSGEETGGYTGAKIITDNFLEYLNPVAVYGEGGAGLPGVLRDSDRKLFGVSVTDKRTLWLEVKLKMDIPGGGGHGAIPPVNYVILDKIRGLNRLANRTRKVTFDETTKNMFNELGKIETGLRGLALRNTCLFRPFIIPAIKREEIIYSLVTNTVTMTSITTPHGPPNMIPHEITTILDCRLLPGQDTEEFLEIVKKILGNEEMSITILHHDIKVPPTRPDRYYYFMKHALQQVYPGAGVIPVLAPAGNDNNYFRAHGVPAYGILPVFIPVHLLETIHDIDERIPVDAIDQGIEVYRELIRLIIESE
jgi:carboxypeptidase PM20D1